MKEIKVLHDQHMHSKYSEDSHASITEYIRKAEREGASYFITCEHVDFCPPTQPKSWIADFKKRRKEFESIKTPLTLLYGIELGCRLDHKDEMDEILKEFDFDLVQLSIHDDGVHDFYKKEAFDSGKDSVNRYLDAVYEGAKGYDNYDVLSHFDYGLRTAKDVNPQINFKDYEEKFVKIFKLIIAKDKALEINAKTEKKINDDEYLMYILRLYKSLGGKKLTLSSDAHKVRDYRYHFSKYQQMIKEAGFESLWYFVGRIGYEYKL